MMNQSSCSLVDIYPPEGRIQDLYCDAGEDHLHLSYIEFDKEVSGVRVHIWGLPVLHCYTCDKPFLPDASRFAIIMLHEEAVKQGWTAVKSDRKKPNLKYNLTPIPFDYDSHDYR